MKGVIGVVPYKWSCQGFTSRLTDVTLWLEVRSNGCLHPLHWLLHWSLACWQRRCRAPGLEEADINPESSCQHFSLVRNNWESWKSQIHKKSPRQSLTLIMTLRPMFWLDKSPVVVVSLHWCIYLHPHSLTLWIIKLSLHAAFCKQGSVWCLKRK